MELCLLSGLTGSEWAAWVQAIGSILAILSAAGIAIWQSNKQHASALLLQREERRYARIELTKSLLQLARNSERLLAHIAGQLNNDRARVHEAAEGERHLDLEELIRVEHAVSGIPLHSLPEKLVTYTMLMSASVRQFREKVQGAMQHHRQMDAAAFIDLFRSITVMHVSLERTRGDIEGELRAIEK